MSYRKIGAPVADAVASSRSTPFLRTAAAAAGGAAQLLGRENPSKIGRLAHYNFAQCVIRGRWHAWALHACMCARALEMPFSSTFSAAVGVTELLLGWDVAQRLARLALSNVAERGIGSRGRVGCVVFAMSGKLSLCALIHQRHWLIPTTCNIVCASIALACAIQTM